MERTITVYNSSTQRKTVIENADVSTLGELKVIMSNKGIDFADMDFLEGVSQTRLLNDNSVLPHDIPFKGRVTNDLLIYLTLANRKIKSGIHPDGMTRSQILGYIKDNCLGDVVMEIHHRHYTQVPSKDLLGIIRKAGESKDTGKELEKKVSENKERHIVEAFKQLLYILESYDFLDGEDLRMIMDTLDSDDEDDGKGFSKTDIREFGKSLLG